MTWGRCERQVRFGVVESGAIEALMNISDSTSAANVGVLGPLGPLGSSKSFCGNGFCLSWKRIRVGTWEYLLTRLVEAQGLLEDVYPSESCENAGV